MDCPKGTSACGAGVRLAGDVVYSRMPQISVGFQHKRNRDLLIPRLVGAPDDGPDVYLGLADQQRMRVGHCQRQRLQEIVRLRRNRCRER